MTLSRRSLITGLVNLVAAPAIVRAGSLMPVKVVGIDFAALTLEQYSDIVRRAFVPRLFVQLVPFEGRFFGITGKDNNIWVSQDIGRMPPIDELFE